MNWPGKENICHIAIMSTIWTEIFKMNNNFSGDMPISIECLNYLQSLQLFGRNSRAKFRLPSVISPTSVF